MEKRKRMSFRIENLLENPVLIPTVAGWIYHEFIETNRIGITESDVIGYLHNRYLDKIPMTFVGLLDSECIGTVSLFSNDLKQREDLTPWIAALYISEKHRNRGYAKELLSFASVKAGELGFRTLYLRTETASEYYRKLGWTEILDTIDEYGLKTKVFEKSIC